MIEVPPALIALATQELWQMLGVFLRVSAVVSLMPAFGERSIPVRVKLAIAIVFALIVAPAVGEMPLPASPLGFAAFAIPEILVGLALGVAIRLFVLALQTAGSIAAQATSLSQFLGGAGEPLPAMGMLLALAGTTLALILGLHVRAAAFLIHSYTLFPAGDLPVPSDMARWGVAQVARSFGLAFTLATPFVIASLLYNLALGVINRAMPQLMVAFVGAPAITMAGLFLLFICTPVILPVWVDAMFAFLADPAGAP
ncbi:flagellar biosynthetic protein FliR [Lutimaribacter marinistellae]|uniref:Flagellar biosynthetic protein FliR n=1 Tax=Lutimaribacter marinistellae TaxID=1820329 RepID=A0ABV7TDE1_9RHOB